VEVIAMSIGEVLLHESSVRLHSLRRAPAAKGRRLRRVLHWGAWLNYLLSVVVLTAGITAGWRFAEIGVWRLAAAIALYLALLLLHGPVIGLTALPV